MINNNNHIKTYTAEDIRNYWNGKMTARQMYELEKASLDDPFLSDALEGYAKVNDTTSQNDINWLRQQLNKENDNKVIPLYKARWFRVAAMLLIVCGLASLSYFIFTTTPSNKNIAQVPPGKEEQPLHKNDSISPVVQAPTAIKDSTPVSSNTRNLPQATGIREEVKPVQTDEVFEKHDVQVETVPANARENKDEKAVATSGVRIDAEKNIAVKPAQNAFSDSVQEITITRRQSKLKEKNANNDESELFGKVTGVRDEPIPGALVKSNNFNNYAVTDKNGYFRLKVPDTAVNENVTVSSFGFETTNQYLKNRVENKIRLLENKNASNEEMVVVGYGTRKKESLANSNIGNNNTAQASPKSGWDAYNNYIAKNKRDADTIRGEVILSFDIDKNGKPVNISVEKSLSKEQDKEAVRLLKEGAEWQPVKSSNVKFSITF